MMLKSRLTLLLSLVVMLVTAVSGISFAADSLTIQGSSTVFPVAQRAAEVYMGKNPDVNISVRGGGSGNGIAALIDGTIDIADASRFIKEKELENAFKNGVYPVPFRVAMDAIAVVVNPVNPVEGLRISQLKDIYTGKITNWKEVGGRDMKIVLISRDSSSGTFETFGELVLDKERVTAKALLSASNGDVASKVTQTEGAIGYLGLGYLSDSVKAVEIDGIAPSLETVVSGSYVLSRPLFMFTDGWPEGLALDFINFVLSSGGQEIVKEQGYVPLF